MWIKVCGIATAAGAQAVIRHSPDAIGLNFYSQSKRCVEIETAREIIRKLPASITPVGLFVNHTSEEIRSICDRCGIRTIQLHGDEAPEFVAGLRSFEILRAFRVGPGGIAAVQRELKEYERLGVSLAGCLVDARVAGAYGGTGHRAPWDELMNWNPQWPPLILAGGLTPSNIAEAIQKVRPFGVDVASGVEFEPGHQNPEAVRQFVQAARFASESGQSQTSSPE